MQQVEEVKVGVNKNQDVKLVFMFFEQLFTFNHSLYLGFVQQESTAL